MRLAEGGSVQERINSLSEVCDKLSAIGEPVKEEDQFFTSWLAYLNATMS